MAALRPFFMDICSGASMIDAESNDVTPAQVRMAAMNLLSLREHSAKELQAKLAKKFASKDLISSVIQKLQQDGLQSDERFTEAFVSMRLRQGKGAVIIRSELKERGIASGLINMHTASGEDCVDWNQVALKAYQKKYGRNPINDLNEKARRIRFLTARGFSSSNIQYVFQCTKSGLDEDPDN
jgi:regulatory protein